MCIIKVGRQKCAQNHMLPRVFQIWHPAFGSTPHKVHCNGETPPGKAKWFHIQAQEDIIPWRIVPSRMDDIFLVSEETTQHFVPRKERVWRLGPLCQSQALLPNLSLKMFSLWIISQISLCWAGIDGTKPMIFPFQISRKVSRPGMTLPAWFSLSPKAMFLCSPSPIYLSKRVSRHIRKLEHGILDTCLQTPI